jgi:penicillin amidase
VPELDLLRSDPRIAEAVGRLAAWDFTTPTGIQPGYDAGDRP